MGSTAVKAAGLLKEWLDCNNGARQVTVRYCLMHSVSNLDSYMNASLSEEASELHHNMGLTFADPNNSSSSRTSMAPHMKKLLRIKSRFAVVSGVR